MSEHLVPLRIPGGWGVMYNSALADVPMEVRDGTIVNFEYFKEDLLMLQQMALQDGRWEVDHSGWLLDVGWYPDSDPSGAFCLTLVRGGWDQIVFRVRHRDVHVIRAAIERLLPGLTFGESLASLQKAVGAEWDAGMPKAP